MDAKKEKSSLTNSREDLAARLDVKREMLANMSVNLPLAAVRYLIVTTTVEKINKKTIEDSCN